MTCATAPCKHPGCPRDDVQAKGYCSAHYQRWIAGRDLDNPPVRPLAKKTRKKCFISGCPNWHEAHGMCQTHLKRRARGADLNAPIQVKAARGSGHLNKQGYRIIVVNGRLKREHRHIMEQLLGRKLREFENVHHKNGRRADNRPENLELWVKSQPSGQRLEDLLSFVVTHYAEEVRTALGEAA